MAMPRAPVAVAALLTLAVTSSSQTPTFRAGVDVVQLSVGVRDSRLRTVTGLTAADFSVFEDGVRQPLTRQ